MRIPLLPRTFGLGRTIVLGLLLSQPLTGALAAPTPPRPALPPCTVQAVAQNVTVSLNSSGTATVTAAQVNNGSTSSCSFTLSVSPSSFTCANLGANTVTLTVTASDNTTSTATATVTVQDVTAPVGAGMGPLPAAPATAVANVPEAAGYGVLYQLNAPTAAAFNNLATVPYAVNNSGLMLPGGNPARVAYYLELTNSSTGAVSWAWASMDNFATTLAQLGVPHPTANNVVWHQSVTNLNVAASSGSGVTTGSGKTGRVEMWYWDYAAANGDNVPGASGSTYDFGDQSNGNGGYGSFQVHNLTNAQTVLAYNRWGSTNATSDIGLGNQGTGQPDWTFAYNATTYSVRKLYILVPNGGDFTQSATLTLNASGQATLTTGNVYTGATDNCSGTPTVALSKTAFTCADLGTSLVNVTVTDGSGNSATQLATVTVQDGTAPTPHAQNVTVNLDAFGSATVTAAQVNNGSTDNCGVTTLSVSPSSFTCANLGANTVTLTVADASGNTATTTATVTVQDVTPPSAGVLPPAPATAVANVPEAAGYGVLYQLNAPASAAAFNNLASVPYTVNNSGLSIPTPARVAYYLELTNNSTGAVSWAWASMDNFATTLTQLGIPHPTTNNVAWHQSVSNLKVFASSGSGVTTGSGKTGRVEMWPSNYAQGNVDNVPGASGSTYDFGDQNSGGSGYGSFQVHSITDAQTVLAYNNWGTSGGAGDIGLGNQSTGNPDWTFANNAGIYSVRRLYILVPNGSGSGVGSFVQNATLSLPASGTATLIQSQVYRGASDNCGIASVTVTPSSFTCANLGANSVTVTVTDNSGNATSQTTTVTVVDNLAPIGSGGGVLPAAPATAIANVSEASSYGVVYQLDVPTAAAFNTLASVPYAVNNSGATMATPQRVAYYLELTNASTGAASWAWASMDNFASTLTQLGLPHPTANNVVWRQSVNNLNVFASSGSGVITGSGKTGRIEMWPSNYGQANVDNVPGASGSTYDFGDQNNGGSGYGSFQVHSITDAQTVLAYNNWGASGSTGDIGLGNQGTGQPDWTFANNANAYSVKRLYVLALNTGSFVQNATLSIPVGGTAILGQNQVFTGATDNCTVTSVVVSPTTFTCANAGVNTVQIQVTDNSGNVSTQSAFVTVSVPVVATTTWNGATSTDWTDCTNWSYGRVPNTTTNAVLPAGLATYPSLPAGTYPVQNLSVASGATLTTAGGATLQVSGDWTNNGTVTLAGPVVFTGSAATQTIGGGPTNFTALTVNKASGTVQLAQNLPIGTSLTMTSGTLTTTSSYFVQLGSTATVSETNANYVIGAVRTTRTLTPGTAETFGGLGLTLTPAAGSTAPGSTPIIRTTGTAINGAGSSTSILRNFNITPATNTGLNVTMNFNYFAHDLNGIPVANLALFKSVSGGTPWQLQRYTTAGTNVVTKTGISDFSVWTLGNSANPLPVELTDFTAQVQGDGAVRVAWSTASEKNTDRFEVERGTDGRAFERIGTVAAAGSNSAAQAYVLLDRRLPAGADRLYYRLRQVDLDGTASYSPVRTVAKPANSTAGFSALAVYPNPTSGRVQVSGLLAGSPVQVRDALGRVVSTATAPADGSELTLTLPAGLAAGVYVVQSGGHAVRLALQ